MHPKDVQDGKVELSDKDITTNLPYDSRAGIVFDHHESETIRNKEFSEKKLYHRWKSKECRKSSV